MKTTSPLVQIRTDRKAKPEGPNRREVLAAGGAGILVALFRIKPADASRAEKTYAYVVDIGKCIGCGVCARACVRENDVPEGNYRTWVERYVIATDGQVLIDSPDGARRGFGPPAVAKDKVARSFFVPKLCNHCANPPCVQVCPVGATFRTPDGVVLVDQKRCIGCGYCVQSCPYSARFINPATHTADKCTWCYHRITRDLAPACVQGCPVGARRFGEVREGSEMQKFLREQGLDVLRASLGTEPAVYYSGLTREVT